MLEMRHIENFSKKFFFLSSTTDRSELVNKFLDKVSLSTFDCLQEDFKKYSHSNKDFNPADLDVQGHEREDAAKTIQAFFKNMGEICYGKLIRNLNYLVQNQTI